MHRDDRSSASAFFSCALLTGLPPRTARPPSSPSHLLEEPPRPALRTHRPWMIEYSGIRVTFSGTDGRGTGRASGADASEFDACNAPCLGFVRVVDNDAACQSSSNWNRIPFGLVLLGVDSAAVPRSGDA